MKLIPLAVCVISVLVTGSISGLANAGSINTWYREIRKPVFNPPSWIFGPVWTVLYLLMGISLYLIWEKRSHPLATAAFTVFGIQLALNFCWSFLFFYFRSPGWAFAEIIAMWAAIVWMLLVFRRIEPAAAWINLPYLLWVSFATVLNGSIWYLNR